jgi:hypothetical protein
MRTQLLRWQSVERDHRDLLAGLALIASLPPVCGGLLRNAGRHRAHAATLALKRGIIQL